MATANVNWRSQFPDVFHMNSIQYDGNGASSSAIDTSTRSTGGHGNRRHHLEVGRNADPESLTIRSSPYPTNFSGQHDARLLPNGELTVHDDGTLADRPPRALLFKIDTTR